MVPPMQATNDRGALAVRHGSDRGEPGARPSGELEDSWFHWPKPPSAPPPRPQSTPPESLDDGLADAWFR